MSDIFIFLSTKVNMELWSQCRIHPLCSSLPSTSFPSWIAFRSTLQQPPRFPLLLPPCLQAHAMGENINFTNDKQNSSSYSSHLHPLQPDFELFVPWLSFPQPEFKFCCQILHLWFPLLTNLFNTTILYTVTEYTPFILYSNCADKWIAIRSIKCKRQNQDL